MKLLDVLEKREHFSDRHLYNGAIHHNGSDPAKTTIL